MKPITLAAAAAVLLSAISCTSANIDEGECRNVALHRAAYHSSAADYNFTAQLVTDGIVEAQEPVYYTMFETIHEGECSYSDILPKHRKESVFAGRRAVHYKIFVPGYELTVLEHGIHQVPDGMLVNWAVKYKEDAPQIISGEFMATKDGGQTWSTLHSIENLHLEEAVETKIPFDVTPDDAYRGYKMILHGQNVREWTVLAWDFFRNGQRLNLNGNEHFGSVWIAQNEGPQWLTIDLGAVSRIRNTTFHWQNRPESGRILVSKDGVRWRKAGTLPANADCPADAITWAESVKARGKGRFVKVEMTPAANQKPLILSELEVWGSNDLKAAESNWHVARASEADDPSAWLPAKVPGTVLSAFADAGAVPDISYGNDQEYISDSYFNADFIYRGTIPFEGPTGRKVFLDFGGINWKADVSLNGTPLGKIEGAFTRGRFDVSGIVREGPNEVEVLIHRPATPGPAKGCTLQRIPPNGGVLGADNPTFHASIGWDWIPTVRGRNIGIWRDVRFTTSGDVTVADPLVQTVLNLPDTTRALVTGEALLTNLSDTARKVLWEGKIGDASFAETVLLRAGEKRPVRTRLTINNPRLWWPNGHGEPYLYDASMKVSADGEVSDSLAYKAGIRQMSYSTDGGRLTAWVNGRRVSGRGGNWGFSELNLRYTQREYDIVIGYHKQMNFNMIRNWVGQTADEEFYDACDRYGIMVWQDFWLANPTDGPDPDDDELFLANAEDYVRKIRRHPCVVLYCGRNEGMPPAALDKRLDRLVAALHGDIFYMPDSAAGLVSGRGPYNRRPSSEYYTLWGLDRMHSERGATNVSNYESLQRFMPEDSIWPLSDMWGIHDFGLENAQKPGSFYDAVVKRFGEPAGVKQFSELAQWVNYDEFRAIFEARSAQRRGILLWMSHTAWPSLVWSPYDYYFDPDAAFFASKKACEPIHIQYNPFTSKVEVVNMSAGCLKGLSAGIELMDMNGARLSESAFALDSEEDTTFEGPEVELPEGKVSYLRLKLSDSEGVILSENFYVLGNPEDELLPIMDLPKAKVACDWSVDETEEEYLVSVKLSNKSKVPAMMLRLMLFNSVPVNSGPAPSSLLNSSLGHTPQDYRILPAEFSNNFFHLMPGESREVTIRVAKRHFDMALKPELKLKGFNL
ncbi:MAG: discoidin domain-containing protein [Bacteroidales bacterium]|nr:discoidin domain-containing protein [Bacteroidales bacterium]